MKLERLVFCGSMLAATASAPAQPGSAAPVFARQPASVTEIVGGNVAFSVFVAGDTAPSFQWRRNGTPLPGATAAVLFLPSVQPASAATYTCVATHAGASVESAPATLTVLASAPVPDAVDPTFNPNFSIDSAPTVAALQPDGKILVGGAFAFFIQGRQQSGLLRILPDGALDPSFQPGPLVAAGRSVSIIVLQPDGKIIVAGPGLFRLHPDGSRDTTFTAPPSVGSGLRQVELMPDGRLVLVNGSPDVVRLNPDGSIDPTWRFRPLQVAAGSGTSIGLVTCTVERVAAFRDGRLALVAKTPLTQLPNFDPFSPPRFSQFARPFTLDTNGLVAGTFWADSSNSTPTSPRLLRVLADQSVVMVGAPGGASRISPGQNLFSSIIDLTDSVSAESLLPDGTLWIAGGFATLRDSSASPAVVVPRRSVLRLNPDLTPSNYHLGLGLTDAEGRLVAPKFILALPDGRALVGGDFVRVDSVVRPQLARLKATSPLNLNPAAVLDADYTPVREGESYRVSFRITGSPPFNIPADYTYDPATGAATTVLKSPGRIAFRAANPMGAGPAYSLVATSVPSAPVIVAQPSPVRTNPDRSFFLDVSAIGTQPLNYNWFKDGRPVSWSFSTYQKTGVTLADAGDYHVRITNKFGSTDSRTVRVTVKPASRLRNFSTLGLAGRPDSPLIIGVVVEGHPGMSLLVRAVGAALGNAPFRIGGVLNDPRLAVFDAGGAVVLENDNAGQGKNVSYLNFVSSLVRAFPLNPADAAEYFSPPAGAHTMVVAPSPTTAGSAGIALAEVYDIGSAAPRLAGCSARSYISGNTVVMRAGFIVGGDPSGTPMRLLIRAVGPGLRPFGVADPVSDPTLVLVAQGTGQTIATNNDWEQQSESAEIMSRTPRLTFPLTRGSRDAAMIVTVPPGSYSCIVSGHADTAGTALLELFEIYDEP